MASDSVSISAALDDRASWQLSRAARISGRLVDDALSGQEIGRLHSIVVLSIAEGPQTQAQLRHELRVDGSDLVAVLDKLEELGWITRTPDPQDRRRNTIKLTATGRRKAKAVQTALARAEGELLGGLSEREQTQLVRLLAKIGR